MKDSTPKPRLLLPRERIRTLSEPSTPERGPGVRLGRRGLGDRRSGRGTGLLAGEVDEAFSSRKDANTPPALDTGTVLSVDAVPTTGIAPCIDAMAQMGADGATPTVILVHPLTGLLAKVKEPTGSNKPVLVARSGPTRAATRSLNGLPVEVSGGVPGGTAYVMGGTRTVALLPVSVSSMAGDVRRSGSESC